MVPYRIDTPALAGYDHFDLGYHFALLQTSLACELKTALERLETGVCYFETQK